MWSFRLYQFIHSDWNLKPHFGKFVRRNNVYRKLEWKAKSIRVTKPCISGQCVNLIYNIELTRSGNQLGRLLNSNDVYNNEMISVLHVYVCVCSSSYLYLTVMSWLSVNFMRLWDLYLCEWNTILLQLLLLAEHETENDWYSSPFRFQWNLMAGKVSLHRYLTKRKVMNFCHNGHCKYHE